MGRTLEKLLMSRFLLIFSASSSVFCHKSEKIDTHAMNFVTAEEKDGKGNLEMSESSFSPSKHCFEIDKIDRFDVLNFPSSSTSSCTAKVYTITTNTITKPGFDSVGSDSIKKRNFLGEWKRLNDGKSLRQKKINLVKQTDESKSGYGSFYKGVSAGGNGHKRRRVSTEIFWN